MDGFNIYQHGVAGYCPIFTNYEGTRKRHIVRKNNCKRILESAGIEYFVRFNDRGDRNNAKPAWELCLEARPRVIAVLDMVYPYLVSKKAQADLVLEWLAIAPTPHADP